MEELLQKIQALRTQCQGSPLPVSPNEFDTLVEIVQELVEEIQRRDNQRAEAANW